MIDLKLLFDDSIVIRELGPQIAVIIWEYDRRLMTELEAQEIKQAIFDNRRTIQRIKKLLKSKITNSDGGRIAETVSVKELEEIFEDEL